MCDILKTVLILSYYFPPDPEIGGLRINGLAKYLPYFGWEPVILTKDSPESSSLNYNIIRTSCSEYDSINSFKQKIGFNPKETVKKQLGKSNFKNKKTFLDVTLNFAAEFITYPDNQKKWYSHAFGQAEELLTNKTIDAIISTSSPVISHMVACDLHKKYGIPWIADLRDLWTQNHYYPYSRLRRKFEKRLETKTLSMSNALTTVSNNLVSELEILHSGLSIYSIPNGFDIDELSNESIKPTAKFTLTYTGNLYQGKRDPAKLFRALKELFDERKLDRKYTEVLFYGRQEDWMKQEIEKYELQGIVHDCGLVPRNVSLIKQRESQILLLLLWDHPSEVGVYTGKVFEYIASKRPILAIGGQKGVVYELLKETEAGKFVSSVEDIKHCIVEFYNEYKLNGQVCYKGNASKIEKYSQKEMARKFAEVLSIASKK